MTQDRTGRARWTDLFSGPRRASGSEPVGTSEFGPFGFDIEPKPGSPAETDDLGDLFDRIQADALSMYAERGLPTEPGHYARGPGQPEWRLVAHDLTPSERFAMIDRYPSSEGWRFARLHDLGRHSQDHDLRAASALLEQIDRLRTPDTHEPAERLMERAILLGAAWEALGRSHAEPVQLSLPKRLTDRWAED